MPKPTIINFETLTPLLKLHIECDQVPFLAGEPGIGKSAILKSLADKLNTRVFTLSVNQLGTREDLTGARSVQDPKTKTYRQVFFPHAIIQEAIDYALNHQDEHPILFMDEINRTSTDVTSAVMALITERRVGTTDLPSNLRLVAAGNDKGNVNSLDLASISRMQVYHVEPDVVSFVDAQPNLNFYIKRLVQKDANLLVQIPSEDDLDDNGESFDDDEIQDGDLMTQVTVPRTLTYMSDFLNKVGLDGTKLPDNLSDIYEAADVQNSPLKFSIEATLGQTASAEQLFDIITESIENLSTAAQPQTSSVNVPKANQHILDVMYHEVEGDNDVNDLFKDKKIPLQDFANTYMTLVQPANYQKVQYPQAMELYYKNLAIIIDNEEDIQVESSKTFSELIRNKQITSAVLDTIQNSNDPYSTRLNAIINALG